MKAPHVPIPPALRTSHGTLYATDQAAAAIEPERRRAASRPSSRAQRRRRSPRRGAIFFCILFNYTILRDTKDVLVVTAPKIRSRDHPLPEDLCVNLPGAIAFTVLYGSLSNRFSQPQVFRGVVSTFLGFFAVSRGSFILTLSGQHILTGWLMLLKKFSQAPSRHRLPS